MPTRLCIHRSPTKTAQILAMVEGLSSVLFLSVDCPGRASPRNYRSIDRFMLAARAHHTGTPAAALFSQITPAASRQENKALCPVLPCKPLCGSCRRGGAYHQVHPWISVVTPDKALKSKKVRTTVYTCPLYADRAVGIILIYISIKMTNVTTLKIW